MFGEPAECSIMTGCKEVITGWSLGMTGRCYGDNYGVRIGRSGYRVVVMEVNNMINKAKFQHIVLFSKISPGSKLMTGPN